MTAHDHCEYVDGCYRCELSREDVVAGEVYRAVHKQAKRLAEEAPAVRYMAVGYGYALVFDGGKT